MKVDRMIPRITISANDGFVASILVLVLVLLLVLNLICKVSLLKNIRPVTRIGIALFPIPINTTRNIAGNLILETHSHPMMLDLLIFVSVLCLIQSVKLKQVSVKASDLCF